MARYSGARPPGMTRPSYWATSIESKVALSAKLWPLDSEYVCKVHILRTIVFEKREKRNIEVKLLFLP